jgi:hypothetical protein
VIVSNIGATDFKPLICQYFSDTAHAGAGDTNEVNPLDATHRMQM